MATDGDADEFSGYDAVGVQPRKPEDTGFERIFSSTGAELGPAPLPFRHTVVLTIGQSSNASWFYLRMFAFTSSTVDALLTRGELHKLSSSLDSPQEFRAHAVTVRQCLNGNGVTREAEDNLTDLLILENDDDSEEEEVGDGRRQQLDEVEPADLSEPLVDNDGKCILGITPEFAKSLLDVLPFWDRLFRNSAAITELEAGEVSNLARAIGSGARTDHTARAAIVSYAELEPRVRPFAFLPPKDLSAKIRVHDPSADIAPTILARRYQLASLEHGVDIPVPAPSSALERTRQSIPYKILKKSFLERLSGKSEQASSLGLRNEAYVIERLTSDARRFQFSEQTGFHLQEVFSVGLVMMATAGQNYMRGSADGVLELKQVDGNDQPIYAVLEIKTRTNRGTFATERATRDMVVHKTNEANAARRFFHVDARSDLFGVAVPSRHERTQLLHHATVFKVEYVLLVLAGDCRSGDNIVAGYLVKIDEVLQYSYLEVLAHFYETYLLWFYKPLDEDCAEACPEDFKAAARAWYYCGDEKTFLHAVMTARAVFRLSEKLGGFPLPVIKSFKPHIAQAYSQIKSGDDVMSRMMANNNSHAPTTTPSSILVLRHLCVMFIAHHRLLQIRTGRSPPQDSTLKKYRSAANSRLTSAQSLAYIANDFFEWADEIEAADRPAAPARREVRGNRLNLAPIVVETVPCSGFPIPLPASEARIQCSYCSKRCSTFCAGCRKFFCWAEPEALPVHDQQDHTPGDDSRSDVAEAVVHLTQTNPPKDSTAPRTCFWRGHRLTHRLEESSAVNK